MIVEPLCETSWIYNIISDVLSKTDNKGLKIPVKEVLKEVIWAHKQSNIIDS